jgi:hypothetical protein
MYSGFSIAPGFVDPPFGSLLRLIDLSTYPVDGAMGMFAILLDTVPGLFGHLVGASLGALHQFVCPVALRVGLLMAAFRQVLTGLRGSFASLGGTRFDIAFQFFGCMFRMFLAFHKNLAISMFALPL